jgi:hypothetical protein
MGLLVLNYTTTQGFVVPELYLQLNSVKMLKTLQGSNYGMSYAVLAYKSVEDKDAGVSPIALPNYLAYTEEVLTANDFYDQTVFGFAYDAIKRTWQSNGYIVQNYYPHPPTPTTYIYDCSGYSFRGFNCAGYDKDGYGRDGFNKAGWDRQGYGRDGFNAQGWDRDGYGRDGFNAEGWDRDGYGRDGFNAQGCNRQHLNKEGTPCPAML